MWKKLLSIDDGHDQRGEKNVKETKVIVMMQQSLFKRLAYCSQNKKHS